MFEKKVESWVNKVAVKKSDNKDYDYIVQNISDEDVEFMDSNEFVTDVPAGTYCYMSKDMVVNTLKSEFFNGKCSNAYLSGDNLVLEG